MDWENLFPIVFFPLKIIVLGVGMFFSIKWHHDQAKKDKQKEADRRDAMGGAPDAGVKTTLTADQA
ncbi:hypothetical protein DMC25_25730 [Caulobacter sp. D4A]|uniref:hypothetical protein n=1 Tax=unclassified Caulobacter TaxID=2648921 RepID=UPI000D72C6FD|nr:MULTISPECIES: hypothetical protein [unclassified Caulobacter]PXA74277.1 hypothetical protein DMC25_25730 [Caulobacter sp. D4A]PXA96867.1 hypothetical protein DMC18_00415 [Caulobacter sp. D5]